ncbi:MAG TPA: EAL domain-containing protein [Thermoleophilaceae bacterium]|nr:EAL domain-containing protein [Thermoleophilaceae bacterium]
MPIGPHTVARRLRFPLPAVAAGGDPSLDAVTAARALAVLHLTGATLAFVWMLLPHGPEVDRAGLAVCVGVAFVFGVALATTRRIRIATAGWVLAATISLLISPAIYFSDAPAAFGLFLVWAALWLYYFLPVGQVLSLTVLIGVGYAGALAAGAGSSATWGDAAGLWAMMMTTVVVAGSLVRQLTDGLRQSHERWRLVFRRNPLPMWIHDEVTGALLDVNDSAVAHYGYSRDEFLRMTVADLTAEPPAGPVGNGQPVPARHRKADGSLIDVEVASEDVSFAGAEARLALATDVTDRLAAERRLRYHADHDALTGLLNRRRFEEEALAVTNTDGAPPPVALLLLDVDHLKLVNDCFGHAAGDVLIRRVAARMRERAPLGVPVARLGGDEFAILVPGAGRPEAEALASAILDDLRSHVWHGLGRVSASIGIALSNGSDHAAPDDLLVAADFAMHASKDAGGHRWMVSDAPHQAIASVHQIRDALAAERLVLHAQPILDLETGAIARHELLVRMVRDDGTLIPPALFIPAAERFGLITEIDRWVARQGARLARSGTPVAVNVSAHSIGDEAFTDLVATELAGSDGGNLVFELTETAVATNFEEAHEFAERLAALGCPLALDDFGTGFGSFAYLKHVTAATLKVDSEFVRDLPTSPADQRVVRAIVTIAETFGQEVVAEGVESAASLRILRSYGIRYAQGNHIGMPQPIAPGIAGSRLASATASG